MRINYRFLNKEEASFFLQKNDEFLSCLNKQNINFYVKRKFDYKDLSLSDYKKLIKKSCSFFSKRKQKKISIIMNGLDLKYLNIPDLDIFFIQTNGNEAFNLPYTRHNCIILPSNYSIDSLSRGLNCINKDLLVHEIFHIISRSNVLLKDKLYKIFGFNKKDNFYHDNFIINPDCPEYNYSIILKNINKNISFEAILNLNYDEKKKKLEWNKIFNREDNSFIDKKETNINELIRDTDYVIHPEEICAEYFRKITIDGLNNDISKRFINEFNNFFNKKIHLK